MTKDAVKRTVFALTLTLLVALSFTAARGGQRAVKSKRQVNTVPLPERGKRGDRSAQPQPTPSPTPAPSKSKGDGRKGGGTN